MMHATTKIAQLVTTGQHSLLPLYTDLVTKYGTVEDADYLLPLFVQTKEVQLLKPLQACGNYATADTLFQQAVEKGTLKAGFPPQTFKALGYLQHAATEDVLLEYYKGLFTSKGDWDLHVAVCLALLNYSCAGYETIIQHEIEKCLEEWLFPELIPVLACKTGDETLLKKMYEHGSTKASSDASAGLLLGMALYGPNGKELFKKAIWNEAWEAGSASTGNRQYAMMGMGYLQLSFAELLADATVLVKDGNGRLTYPFFLLESLLEANLAKPVVYDVRSIPPPPETFAQVYQTIFEPEDGNSIFQLVRTHVQDERIKQNLESYFEQLQTLYKLKATHELEIECLQGK